MRVVQLRQFPAICLSHAKKQWFLLGLIAAVILATLFPELGRSGGTLHGDVVANTGVALVFFMYGLGVSLPGLRRGLSRWRIHLFVQSYTFALFPLIGLVAYALFRQWLPEGLALGFFYLCALPSTISSSVAMTAMGRGNVPAAIFNATVSSILGIVLTPALVASFASLDGAALSIPDAMFAIAKLLLLPLALGQALRPLLHHWHVRYRHCTGLIDRWVILILVYTTFCNSVASGLWRDNGPGVLLVAFLGSALILVAILALATQMAKGLKFPIEDEIASVFCASAKALAVGVPMAKLLFGAHPALGLIVLPIMFYHQLQLFVGSFLANRYARREKRIPATAGNDRT